MVINNINDGSVCNVCGETVYCNCDDGKDEVLIGKDEVDECVMSACSEFGCD